MLHWAIVVLLGSLAPGIDFHRRQDDRRAQRRCRLPIRRGSFRYVAVDPPGRFAYVSNSSSASAFRIDATTGALSPVSGSPFNAGSDANAIAIPGAVR